MNSYKSEGEDSHEGYALIISSVNEFYNKCNPSKIENIPSILKRFFLISLIQFFIIYLSYILDIVEWKNLF